MQPTPAQSNPVSGPRFAVTERRPPSPVSLGLAVLTAGAVLFGVAFGLGHRRAARFHEDGSGASRAAGGASGGGPSSDEADDPSQVDTIVLGDAADAPVPRKKTDHISDVHATIIVQLPRYGEGAGLIPDSPAGHLLFKWLAAFNQASETAMETVLPNDATVGTASALMELRIKNGGYRLLSSKEVQPGVIVFRLRDQTKELNEVLGTLQMRAQSEPPAIASFSLRAVE